MSGMAYPSHPTSGTLLGQTSEFTYVKGPSKPAELPCIAAQENKGQCDTYPVPQPHRRSLTLLPWRPSVYYSTSRVSPCHSIASQNMPAPQSCRTELTAMDNLKVPPVFAAARNALYTRYTENDWLASCHSNYLALNRVIGGAENLREGTMQMATNFLNRSKQLQLDTSKKLGERLGDINFWKTELMNELDSMISESNSLNEAKTTLTNFLTESENPLHISQECMYHRERRQSIDLVHDQPEKNLVKEIDMIKRVQEKMRNTIDRTNVQLGLNRAAQHELEKDAGDKFLAENLDTAALHLKNNSRGIAYHDGVHRIENNVSCPQTWAGYSNSNIQRSQSERSASKAMREEIECVINTCVEDMWKMWNDVNTSLSNRIQQTTDARNKTSQLLHKTLQEVFDTERTIDYLKNLFVNTERPMQVAQTRLDMRLRRQGIELCRDAAHQTLVCEVGQITETVDRLQNKLREAENSLQALLRTKGALEHDLSIKNNTLFIDREKCLAMRKTFPLSPRVVCL